MVATVGNLNTDVGAALVILSVNKNTQIVVIEMGASELNEIASYCQMVEPTYGLITAIGEAHLDTFGNLDGVYQAKRELYDYLYRNGRTIFLNTTEPSLRLLSNRFIYPITYPQVSDFAPLYFVDASPYVRYRDEEGTEVLTHLLGKFYFHNISAALCIAKYFNVPMTDANKVIKDYIPSNKRMQVVNKGSNLLIVDTHHTNPNSLQAALEAMLHVEAKFRVVILTDMAGLGSKTHIWHKKILNLLESENYHSVLLCGSLFQLNADHLVDSTKFRFFPTKDLLVNYLRLQYFEHSVILLKGANHWEMHTLVENIMESRPYTKPVA